MSPKEPESFDLESVYDEQIAPLMTKIIEICHAHKLPMFATFLYLNDLESGDDGLCTTNLMFDERPIPEALLALYRCINPKRQPVMRLRVRNKEGVVTDETIIMP